MENRYGKTVSYVITDILIADEHDTHLIDDEWEDRLTLITCYPFDAIQTGGPLRYVVIGKMVNQSLLI